VQAGYGAIGEEEERRLRFNSTERVYTSFTFHYACQRQA